MNATMHHHPCCVAEPADFIAVRMPLQHLEPPQPGVAHLWMLDLSSLALTLRGAMGGGDADAGQALEPEQVRFARRFYLKLLLGAYLGLPGKSVRLLRSERGKPGLDLSVHDTDMHFSMAKSGDRVLVGLVRGSPIGVDLEPSARKARSALSLARRYFSAAESEALAGFGPESVDAAFLRAWACKEAVVKASGHGIANRFNCFTVSTDPQSPPALVAVDDDDAAKWKLAMVCPDDGFIGAVAARQSELRFETFRLLAPE